MTKEQAYHICRAAAAIANVEYVTVFGSNAIVFWLDEIGMNDTKELLQEYTSRELDLSVSEEEELNILVDATIGEMSMFDKTFGIYGHANPMRNLFKVPKSWVSRLKVENDPLSETKIVIPHPLDLVFSKMIGFREKDFAFCKRVMRAFKLKLKVLKKLVNEYIYDNPQETEKVLKAFKILQNKVRTKSTFLSKLK